MLQRSKTKLIILLLAVLTVVFAYFMHMQRIQLHTYRLFALDTVVSFKVYASRDQAEVVFARLAAEIEKLERDFSRRGAGYLTSINASPRNPVLLTDGWLRMLAFVDQLHHDSDGAFDPTITPLLDLWGFWSDCAPETKPTTEAIKSTLHQVGWDQYVKLAAGTITVDTGAEIYLGGVAKGYALDRLAFLCREHGVRNAVLDLGGDIALLGGHPNGRGWRIGVQDPRQPGQLIEELELRDCFIATSGDYERGFTSDGIRYHHLLDPRTGYPARQAVSATVIAGEGVTADALATALFILGDASALREQYNYQALVLREGNQVDSFGWPQ